MTKPLANVRVLDLSRILAGPWATQTLADLGAQVIKVEKPGSGDDTRHMGPPFLTDPRDGSVGDAAYFMCCNRGKQSLTLDFTTADGQAVIRRLVAGADVLVENYKVGGLKKYGLDYDSLKGVNPGLVYCSVTGFGQSGPYKDRAGYDYLIQGMGGLMSVTGEQDGRPGGGPQRAGVAVADMLAGMYATVAILAALRHRDQGGGGQHIDISLLDCQVGTLANQGLNYLTTGVAPSRMGTGHPNIAPYQVYPASDGHIIIAVGNDTQFRRLCDAIGRPEYADDARFSTIRARVQNRDSLNAWLEAATIRRTVGEWVALLESAQVPCGPINTIDRVFADPHVMARAMRVDLPHPVYGSVPSIRNPIRFSGTPLHHDAAPPALGQHTEAVLRVAGFHDGEIERLRERGVI
ncbi:CoA transferase [Pigmentiphaga sp. NML080357]|uniref:CaiB/BaiF CoA transferase family protein n=1 Tax=Pigmentiphaga sp. NML080357 TaxID=2008675 RepID=UPI000B417856|nr:CaiB/BaiF CoA-transferase family protein [Pigmentiphaga sp. NML080357]OVZ59421.1 CoA transferase [Pigmentiphaga sp. NML080357]